MGLFGASKQQRIMRSGAGSVNKSVCLNEKLYNVLFADRIDDFTAMKDHAAISWIYSGKTITLNEINAIIADPAIESRLKFLACYSAVSRGVAVPAGTYFGGIIEYPIDKGFDILAYYADGSARYYNHAGHSVVYHNETPSIDEAIKTCNMISEKVVESIGPWEKPRMPRPSAGIVRFTFLVSDGLYLGQGPLKDMMGDQMGNAIVGGGINLMKELIKAVPKS